MAYSYDGANWTTKQINYSGTTLGSRYPLCYGGGKFVSIDNTGRVAYSYDGIEWIITNNVVSSLVTCKSICYGNGKFVAVSMSATNKAAYSYDGINWSTVTLPTNGNMYRLYNVCYGNGIYVIINYDNDGTQGVYYSYDAINWNVSSPVPTTKALTMLIYGGGWFVAGTYTAEGDLIYSNNGIEWKATNETGFVTGTKSYFYSGCYGNGTFVITSSITNIKRLHCSFEPPCVSYVTLPSSDPFSAIAYGNGIYVAMKQGATERSTCCYSYDGYTWKISNAFSTSGKYSSIAFGNGVFVMASSVANKTCLSSSDGINWTDCATLTTGVFAMRFVNDRFVAFNGGSSSSTFCVWSSDGVTWNDWTLPESLKWFDIAYSNGTYVIIANGTNHGAMRKDGDATWTSITIGTNAYQWCSIVYGNNRFAALAFSSAVIAESEDGINWTVETKQYSSGSWRGIMYGNGVFLINHYTTSFYLYSRDLKTFYADLCSSDKPPESSYATYAGVYVNNKFIHACSTNKMMIVNDNFYFNERRVNDYVPAKNVAYNNEFRLKGIETLLSASIPRFFVFTKGWYNWTSASNDGWIIENSAVTLDYLTLIISRIDIIYPNDNYYGVSTSNATLQFRVTANFTGNFFIALKRSSSRTNGWPIPEILQDFEFNINYRAPVISNATSGASNVGQCAMNRKTVDGETCDGLWVTGTFTSSPTYSVGLNIMLPVKKFLGYS